MKNNKKYYISFLLLLFLVVSLAFYITKMVSHQELTREINENISLLLEKTIIKHKKIEIEYGINLKFIVPEMELISASSEKTVLKINRLEIKSPLMSLFFTGFPVSYHFNNVEVYPGKELDAIIDIKKLQERMNYKNLFGLKIFHEGSKHSLLFENIRINNPSAVFPIQYFKLRNFSFDKLVAYEVRHQISNNSLLPNLFADYILIGEVDIGKTINKADLRTKAQLKINRLNVGEMIKIPTLMNGKISLHVGSRSVFDGHISTEGEVELESRFFLNNEILDLHKMTLKMPVSYLSVLKDVLPKTNAKDKILIEGELKGIGSAKIDPSFKFDFLEPVDSSENSFSFRSMLSGFLKGEMLDLSFLSQFSEGNIKGNIQAPVYNDKSGLLFDLDKNISLKLEINNIDLKVMALKKKSFYSLTKNFLKKNDLSSKFREIEVVINNCAYDQRKLSGGGIFKKERNSLSTKQFVINYNKGRLLTDLELHKEYVEGEISFTDFNFEGLAAISRGGRLPISGTYSGKLTGVYSKSNQFSHQLEIDLNGKNGTLVKGESISSVGSAIAKFSPDLKLSKGAGFFSKIKLKGKYANKKFFVKEILYIDKNNELKIQGKATLFISDIKENNYIGEGSNFLVSLFDQKNTLWNKTNSINLPQEVPLKIKRINQEWVPDLLYTINKIKDEN
jgi:hypothetical protein